MTGDDMTGDLTVSASELRSLFLFSDLTDAQLAWIAQRAQVRAFDAGAVVYREGEPAGALWVLLDGRLRLSRRATGEDLTVHDTSQRGVYAGAVRAYDPSAPRWYETSMVATEPSRFLWIAAEDFATLMREWFPMAVHLLSGLYVGMRTTEATVRQREHLAKLGHLAGNLAHELNNPAAATVRATAQLRTRVAGMRHKLGMIADQEIDRVLLARLVALQEVAVERAAKPREPLSALAESDLEDALADRLEALELTAPYELAPVFAAAGLDPGWLDAVAAEVGGEALDGALRWLAYALETEALMDEIEDASARIATLVSAVKQYSHLDQAAHQEVDLHPGLESTLVMLGHKLAEVQVHRDYDRTLPPVPAYASELNQVWTNLIDNAVDAMAGHGVLRLRTAREGDLALVEVVDQGPGIPEQVRSRVFEPFVTTKPAGKGSGLGLDNARRIVERRHGGSLSFRTGPDGTTFAVRLPLTDRSGDTEGGDRDDRGEPRPRWNSERGMAMSGWRVESEGGPTACGHAGDLPAEVSAASACEDCVREGTSWVHLRRCLSCQHVGCCNSSPRRHATAHWRASTHPVVASAEPGEHWAWCYADELLLVPAG